MKFNQKWTCNIKLRAQITERGAADERSWTHPVKIYLSNTRGFSLYSGPKALFSLIYFHFQIVPPDEKTTITATFTVLSYNQIVEIKTLHLLEEIHQASKVNFYLNVLKT